MTNPIAAATRPTIARAAELLRAGELVAFPTETVYGLGADASNPNAVRRIFAAKARPVDHPVIVHIADMQQVIDWAREFPPDAQALGAAFWPGALTLILPRRPAVSDVVTGGQDSVGLRVPSHPVARELLREFVALGGSGIAAPSANRHGRISPTRAEHVLEDLGTAAAMVIDGGPCDVGIESTIVAFTTGEPVLLRPGGISIEAITNVLGRRPRSSGIAVPRASGTLPSHYAPRTSATLVAADALLAEITQRTDRDEEVAVLARTVARPAELTVTWIEAPSTPQAYAHDLYANLRALDAAEADHILIENVPDDNVWLAVRDRLARATRAEHYDTD